MASEPPSGGTTDVASAGHLDTMVAGDAPAAREDSALGRGDAVGRYTILEPLGAGGMGVVYAAYDPQLDRKVAIKLLHRRGRAGGTSRLLREAQAMAKLSHPNVVAVLDVGTRGEQVFVAMEYVAGTTMTAWLVDRRSWREIVDAFVAAGRGLAAAHRVGLLHRDIKPDNILVGDDGRVRVADFGLARAATDSTISNVSDPTDVTAPTAPPVSALASDLTQTGAMLGTPAYMAPEQYRGEASEHADQFSFCVALYEGLYGARPFAGASAEELLGAIVDGRIAEPTGANVPPWVRRVIVRGLAAEPSARWPSMDALLAELARDPTRTRTRVIAAIAAAIVIGGGGVLLAMRGGGARSSACAGAGDQLRGIWDDPHRMAVRGAFLATKAPFALDTWTAVEVELDRYARAWSDARVAACVATERAEPTAALRTSCLERRKHALAEQIDLFAHADLSILKRAAIAAHRLATVESCDDPRQLAAAGLDDERTRALAEPLWAQLDEADPQINAGRIADAKAKAEAVATRAREAGLPRVEGEAQLLLGRALVSLGDAPGAERAYFAAARATLAGADDLRAIDAWRNLAFVVGYLEQRHDEGRRDAELASAALERIGGDERRRADLDELLGTLAWVDGDYAEARRRHEASLAAREKLLGPDNIDVATALVNLAIVEKADGHYEVAAGDATRAIEIMQHALGADHPQLAGAYSNLGNIYGAQGDAAKALEWQRRAAAVAEKSLPPDSTDLAFYLTNLGAALSNAGKDDDALPVYQRALAIQERALGDHADVALTLSNIALIDQARGRTAEARAGFERALAIAEKAYGPSHPAVADYLDELGDALHVAHDDAGALARYQRALAIREAAVGKDNPQVASSLVGLGKALVGLGRARDAIAPLERAVALREQTSGDPADLADARAALAKARAILAP
ncbi:MAG TPA: serine/threonine-protein kinase [Kofleriaceae bacterium]|nr:serine/threonine-protein kinase [Kofleriaceae bacterium]